MAFSHLRVVEFGVDPAIAYAGLLFAGLGADVVKVVSPEGDAAPRPGRSGAGEARDESDGWVRYLDAGKRRMVLDSAEGTGRRAFLDALDTVAILLHGARDRDLPEAARDLSPERIHRAKPDLVVVSVTPFGRTGPLRDAPAEDITLQAIGGMSLGIGAAGRPPLKLPLNQSAYQAGIAAALAAAGALHAGGGYYLDLAAADVWASFYSGVEVANARFGRSKRRRAGHRVMGFPYPRTVLPCRNGYFAVQCSTRGQWRTFLEMVGCEGLADDPLFIDRVKANDLHGERADAHFVPWFKERTKETLLRLFLEHKIPGAPVLSIDEVYEHEHLKSRGYFRTVDGPGGRAVNVPTAPYRLDADSGSRARPAPGLGAHQAEPRGAPDPSSPTPASAGGGRGLERALDGLRVVDFGWVWAGAVPGHILADLGAEVIKIETITRLDYMRQGRPIVGSEKDPEQNPMFHNVNRGKLSFRVDMAAAEGRALLRALVAKSDVVIENFSPGVLDRHGLGWSDLSRVRPDLVMCSMSAVGQTGPLRDIRTYASMIGGLCGLDSLVGYAGERVLGSQSSYADPNASLHAAFAILAALRHRRLSGCGQYIDLSQWEAGVNLMGEAIMDYALNGRVPGPEGNAHPTAAPYGSYRVAGEDAWISLAVLDDAHWAGLRKVLGEPAWTADARFATPDRRRQARAELDAHLNEETERRNGAELVDQLLSEGVPAAPLLDAAGIAAHPHYKARRLFHPVDHPVLGEVPVYGLPWHVNGAPHAPRRRAPLLGEHNDYVLKEVLGMADETIEELREKKVFE